MILGCWRAHLGLEAIELMNGLICGVDAQFVALGGTAPLGMIYLVSVQRPGLALGRLPANASVGKPTSAGRFREVEVYLVKGLPAVSALACHR
jgi:hypothetical protein